jgi:hypothetical protein
MHGVVREIFHQKQIARSSELGADKIECAGEHERRICIDVTGNGPLD